MSKTYTVSSTDHVDAGLTTEVSAPTHPCPACGKGTGDIATREDLDAGRRPRRCGSCKAKSDWITSTPVLIVEN